MYYYTNNNVIFKNMEFKVYMDFISHKYFDVNIWELFDCLPVNNVLNILLKIKGSFSLREKPHQTNSKFPPSGNFTSK